MKKSQKIFLIAVFAIILVANLFFAGCDVSSGHVFHEWGADNEGHYKLCACGEQIGEKEPHSVTDWTTEKQATDQQTGLRRGVCSVCKKEVTEVIPKLSEHTHSSDGGYEYNSYSHFKRCSSCNNAYDIQAHQVSDWTVDDEASAHEYGSKHGVCDVCGAAVESLIPPTDHRHLQSDEWSADDDAHWKECSVCGEVMKDTVEEHSTQWVTIVAATVSSTGLQREECKICEKTFGTRITPKLTSSTRTVDLYAINDFHGEVGKISTIGGYLKERKSADANTLLINSGDMFQGSMESNSNYGKLLTDCMDVIGFDSFTFGNHEFDWGLEKLEDLANNSNVPFLGANIYHWNASAKSWGTFADELAQKYVIKTLDNGLKVGIIGIIGEDQITSISSNLVQTIGFKSPLPIIKELAEELRNDKDCDVVIVSAHVGPQGLVGEKENNGSPSSAAGLQNYVDAVFCAHTHYRQDYVVDGLPFIQGGSYGSYVSNVKLSVAADGEVTVTSHGNISYSNSWTGDSQVSTLVNNSNEKIKDERYQVLANLNVRLDSNPQIPRLVCHAIAEYAVGQGYDIALAMTNNARSSLSKGQLTYSALYEAIPFDNVVYVAKVSGKDILNEAGYSSNSVWRVTETAIKENDYYYIAVIDYLLFHQNTNRSYNYFPSAFTSGFDPVPLTKSGYEFYNYRFITRDFLLNNSKTLDTSLYTSTNNNNDASKLSSKVTLSGSRSVMSVNAASKAATVGAVVDNFNRPLVYFDGNCGGNILLRGVSKESRVKQTAV